MVMWCRDRTSPDATASRFSLAASAVCTTRTAPPAAATGGPSPAANPAVQSTPTTAPSPTAAAAANSRSTSLRHDA